MIKKDGAAHPVCRDMVNIKLDVQYSVSGRSKDKCHCQPGVIAPNIHWDLEVTCCSVADV